MRNLVRGIARTVYRARGFHRTAIRGAAYRCDPYHLGFWRDVGLGRWEPESFEILERTLSSQFQFLDVGAWIGPLTLFAARRARQVFAVEPDFTAYRHLLWNLELNGLKNVIPFNTALGRQTGIRTMWARGDRLGDSKSTMVRSHGAEFKVPCLGWEDWIKLVEPGRIDFIKIDIEGGEFELVPAMKSYLRAEKPSLLLALHVSVLSEETRADALGEIIEAVSSYSRCYSNEGPVDLRSVAEAARYRNSTFLFQA